ncbi:MAG: threonine/serine exporter family protein [Eubacterium sp.]
MDIPWHEYLRQCRRKFVRFPEADLTEKASIVGRVGLMLLSCGTGAWRVRSSMNTISQNLGITCSTDIGLMSIEYTCFDGTSGFSQSLCLTNTGVNTSKLNRLERFIGEFSTVGKTMTGEQLHDHLDEIDRIHGLYSPVALGFAAALRLCGAFAFTGLAEGPWKCCLLLRWAGLGRLLSAAN